MIIDFAQKKDGVDLSYVNSKGFIDVISVPLKTGYYKYVACESWDFNKIPNLTSFRGSHIKMEPDHYFSHHNVNEFLNYDLKHNYPDIYNLTSELNIPTPYSIDIETDITDETGYSTIELAENRILSISITDSKLNTLVFALNHHEHKYTDLDKMLIQTHIERSLGPVYGKKYAYDFNIRFFDSEVEMLNVFLETMNKFFHAIMGWNFVAYDWIYIYNRCERLGIDIKKASPKATSYKKTITLKKRKGEENDSVDVKMPTHRVIADYMLMFKESLIYNNLDSYSLNNISEMILDLHKVMYDGNLRTLYNTNFPKFLAYAIMDTILVMLIHKATNFYNVDFFESYYNGIPYSKISQNAISEALIYNELRNDNIFLLESEKNSAVKRAYKGGYVKDPTQKIIEAGLGEDFSALYPNSIITTGISPERKIDAIEVNSVGRPLNPMDMVKWEKYKAQGCILSPMGRIYDNSTLGLFPRIEMKLQKQRAVFKGHAGDLYTNIIPSIEAELKRRGVAIPTH